MFVPVLPSLIFLTLGILMFLPYNLVELCLISTCEIKHKSLPRGVSSMGGKLGKVVMSTHFLLWGAQAAALESQGHASHGRDSAHVSPVTAPQPGAPAPSHKQEFCPGRLLEKEGPSLEVAREMLTLRGTLLSCLHWGTVFSIKPVRHHPVFPFRQLQEPMLKEDKYTESFESLSNVVFIQLTSTFLQLHLWNITWQKQEFFFISRLFFPFFTLLKMRLVLKI